MIKTVAKITEAKANEIRGTQAGGTLFNPVQDANDNWVISLQTAQFLEANEYEVINWQPKENEED